MSVALNQLPKEMIPGLKETGAWGGFMVCPGSHGWPGAELGPSLTRLAGRVLAGSVAVTVALAGKGWTDLPRPPLDCGEARSW
jgi:hypothetical protein